GSSEAIAGSVPEEGTVEGADPGAAYWRDCPPAADGGGLACARASPMRLPCIAATIANQVKQRNVLFILSSKATELIRGFGRQKQLLARSPRPALAPAHRARDR